MRGLAAAVAVSLLTGCATFREGPQAIAETTCLFAFLAGVQPAGALLGPLLCSFGVKEMPHEKDDLDV